MMLISLVPRNICNRGLHTLERTSTLMAALRSNDFYDSHLSVMERVERQNIQEVWFSN